MAIPLPGCNREYRAAACGIAQKQRGHFPIALIFDRISHRRRVRGEEQSPRPERNSFRAALILESLYDLRDVGQEAKAVEKREYCERDVGDGHAMVTA